MTDGRNRRSRSITRALTAWRSLSIQSKITTISLATSVVVLFFSTIAFIVHDQISFRRAAYTQVAALTDVLASSTRAAVAFRDKETATRLLSLLQADSSVAWASIYDQNDDPFVNYGKPGSTFQKTPCVYRKEAMCRKRGYLCLVRTIQVEGEVIGTLHVTRDLSDCNVRLLTCITIAAVILLVACFAAWRLSILLQALVTRPIMDLRDTAVHVIEHTDYSVRAEGSSGDEVGRLVNAFNDMLEQIQQRDRDLVEQEKSLNDYHDSLRSLVSQLTLAEEEERRRIATDLHDSVCQLLWASRLKLDMAARAENDPAQSESLSEVEQLIDEALKECRTLTFDVSPPELYELGIEAALNNSVQNVEMRYGITAKVTHPKAPIPIDKDTGVVLFRCTQELITNVIKHANASSVDVSLVEDDGNVRITVADNGIGFDKAKLDNSHDDETGGFGIFSVRERIQHLGGTMTIRSTPSAGTRITLSAPISATSSSSPPLPPLR